MSLQLGSYVTYKSNSYIAVSYLPETKLVTILNPVDGITKLNVKYTNVKVLPHTPAIAVQYKDARYLVTAKGLIISLVTKRPMKWNATNMNRICILSLAGVIEQQDSNGEEEFQGDIAGFQDSSDTPEHSDFLSKGVELEEGVDVGEDLEDMLNEAFESDLPSEDCGIKIGDLVRYNGVPLFIGSDWKVIGFEGKGRFTISTDYYKSGRLTNGYKCQKITSALPESLTKVTPCADCGTSFTEEQCEDGALLEIDNNLTNELSSRLVCESCHSNDYEV